uniref:Phosphofructokinase domain-containing protein n=1 Tax=Triticum urartu TaxID=4572 RepID=A0A8R7R2U3_TRIUA
MLGRTRDQIRTTEQVKAAMTTCQALKLDALVIIGGVTSNTDAAQLAETFAESKCSTKVVGVPVTLNGDLKNQFVETTVGFDTICKVNSQLISNVCTDALSAEKYYYFIRLMGRKASHVALECALQSHPNMVLLGEEVAASKLTISDITKQICDAVQARAEKDKYHGVVLIPEGLVESIPELYALLQEIHGLHDKGVSIENISSHLSPWASALFDFLPPFIRKQLLLHPESDDSAQLSQIETEKLLAQLVETEINKRLEEGTYKGKKFNAICHFFGYQARGALPSNFDCDYAYVLGHVCYHIIAAGLNGYMATVTNLKSPVDQWKCGAAPITSMMTVRGWSRGPTASQIGKPAVHMASVDLKGKAYEYAAEAKLFQPPDGRHLQEPWTAAIRRTGGRRKAHLAVRGRPGLHGEDQTAAGVSGEGEEHREAWVLAGCAESCTELHGTCDGAADHHVFSVLQWPSDHLRANSERSICRNPTGIIFLLSAVETGILIGSVLYLSFRLQSVASLEIGIWEELEQE